MNLIDEPWLPFRLRSGAIEYGPPCELAREDVVDLAPPRADFHGAAWQFLIGLLQTTCPPDDLEEWQAWWADPPTAEQLQEHFARVRHAFNAFGDAPLFMQELDPMEDARSASVASLLIEAPGDQGIKFNTDHFIKRGFGEAMCPRCASLALFTMQVNAPAGGSGYRTGLRGGGPLTTLVLPDDSQAPLWQKLWLNVLNADDLGGGEPDFTDGSVFPWLAATRVSKQAGTEITPEEVHPLHAYWAMPRRFRMHKEEAECRCQVCGAETTEVVREVRAKNYGHNYGGAWVHPLTPYRQDPKKPDEPPLSTKGQQGGLGYRHWEALVLEDTRNHQNLPARVVLDYQEKAEALRDFGSVSQHARLWVFGYDMDNMKARGWYATYMPLLAIPKEQGLRDRFLEWIDAMVQAASDAAWLLRSTVKSAWYSRPKDASGDFSFIDQRFWEGTESAFYSHLHQLAERLPEQDGAFMPEDVARRWHMTLYETALELFDELSLAGDAEALDMKRIVAARNELGKRLWRNKTMKTLRTWAGMEEGVGKSKDKAAKEEA
ncbi:CRISPR-associated protein [Halorhodospira halochloris]|uniref:CRISPR-associated protein n=1 Tax=Halorhodospira halochloris TaxID=1052 RepID=A0A0X8X8E3_HALHR|nr:type I-E CRISPR-associated protein Cse1/CasA [Halorhodospira halochloris]MBK1651141.1 type I-E CRISPR-associated protein Cse1/CasA [Halorhodospira halochloris]BAU57410.1 CRISPR-associated protein [Halorhodospira halochloris]